MVKISNEMSSPWLICTQMDRDPLAVKGLITQFFLASRAACRLEPFPVTDGVWKKAKSIGCRYSISVIRGDCAVSFVFSTRYCVALIDLFCPPMFISRRLYYF